MADKDVDGVIAALSTAAALRRGLDRVRPRWPAGAPCRPRSSPPAGATARPGAPPPSVAAEPTAAMDLALAGGRGPVVVAGSLYLVGAVRAILVDDPDLRDPDPGAS